MKLRVPFVRQPNDYTCGPAALAMVSRFFGLNVSLKKLAMLAKTRAAYGTTRRNMLRTLRKLGLKAQAHSDGSIKEMKHFLLRGIPVIVNYRERGEDISHFAVVVALTHASITLHDPWHGPNFTLPLKEFIRHWHGKFTHDHTHWLLIATKP